ncbi:hypothetical protein [His2 virus]|uniref:Uncharacterized protein n=1 Tax=His 2 virus TaxID=128710 RepID=Q25BF9_HIS2V|nr:hypothetical protein His2V_gp01 [His2 virus]AAQ13764.1 hypothetical protein [His2 virus]
MKVNLNHRKHGSITHMNVTRFEVTTDHYEIEQPKGVTKHLKCNISGFKVEE